MAAASVGKNRRAKMLDYVGDVFKGGSPGVSQFGPVFLVNPCVCRLSVVFPHMRGPVIYPLSISINTTKRSLANRACAN